MPLKDKIKDHAAGIVTAMALCAAGDGVQADGYVPPVAIPEQLSLDLQDQLNLKDFQAWGIAGNLAQETSNFRFLQEMDPLVKGSKGGLGYAQWTGSRRKEFIAYANGRDTRDYEVNLGFLIHELQGTYSKILVDLRETETLEEASKLFMKKFLRPSAKHANLKARLNFAFDFEAGNFEGAGCLSHFEVITLWGKEAMKECPQDIASIRPRAMPEKYGKGVPENTLASLSEIMPIPRQDEFLVAIAPETTQSAKRRALEQIEELTMLIVDQVARDPFQWPADTPSPS